MLSVIWTINFDGIFSDINIWSWKKVRKYSIRFNSHIRNELSSLFSGNLGIFFIHQAICNRKSKFLFSSPRTFAMCYFHILWAAPAPRMTLHWQQKDRVWEKRFHPSLCSDSPRLLHCNKMFSVSFASFFLTASRGKIKKKTKKLLLTEAQSSGPSPHQPAHLKPTCDRGPHPGLYQDVRLSWMWSRRLFRSSAPF